ncbi:TetR/AcrR family transcriptional regulator [Kitasatospora sp. NPDC088351]|uniref:TetR/AcrR family transcriptional regulator n=1 Tax=Kitasatospora sp. NPDC088351 TaxID=3155180 RepID=UPI00341B163F
MKVIEDRRVRRTRSALGAALVELVLEKGFHTVTVDQLVERADVGRATFYAHYRDKEDLLVWVVRDLALDRVRVMPAVEQADAGAEGIAELPLLHLFQHAERERPACQVILRGEGDGRALREFTGIIGELAGDVFRSRCRQAGVQPRVPLEVVARAWTGEVVGVLSWWIEGGTGLSAAEVTRHLCDYSAYGRMWASGLSDAPALGSREAAAPPRT